MNARRVVVTGMGIVSCLGNEITSVAESLREGRSGIRAAPDFAAAGLRSQVAGRPEIDLDALIDRKWRRFMGDAAAYAYLAARQALAQSGLDEAGLRHPRTGLIMGSGGGSPEHQIGAADTLRTRGVRRIGPYMVTRCMSSTVSACVATALGIRGLNYSVSSACATSAHCIGLGYQQIAWGMQDRMLVGGGEEVHWGMAMLFDGMGALASAHNEQPTSASRPYDRARDGFVIGGGGGALLLEELGQAQARGAVVLGEIVGYGASSDGADMVAPSGQGAVDCMRQALAGGIRPDYVNTHGTGTLLGDVAETAALREVFGAELPPFSSTKSLGGHALGAAGVHEAIHCLLMLREGFVAGSVNVDDPDPQVEDLPLVRESHPARLRCALSNSFGFGGTNASLLLRV
ncbi:MAG: beta-ketoacyl-ACP synthase I [Xanthomonadales bacterium]|nr:3-oxoacyl-[acyl-carrier-protein] synthase 1 [Xanthomonadales bacterium]MCC6592190.1 beta-ketoacyl-ACP synthase I [Xanthomonadales bacterium]MCE7932368.1 beta-ketoacyl-ACP synthase I [Xanthomonadales bacterium PRO6]